jgi:hypothetical protein
VTAWSIQVTWFRFLILIVIMFILLIQGFNNKTT